MGKWMRVLAVLLTLGMMLSMVACGGQKGAEGNATDGSNKAQGLLCDEDSEVKLGELSSPINPEAVYTSVKYDHRMFWGDYRILGGDDGEKEYYETIPQIEYEGGDGYRSTISAMPYRLQAGSHTLSHILNYIPGKHAMRAYFYNASGNMDTLECAYTVKDNTITLNPFKTFEYDEENGVIRFEMTDIFLTYTFKFSGRTLMLDDGTNTVELHSGLAVSTDDTHLYVDNYLSKGSEPIDKIDRMFLRWDSEEKSGRFNTEEKEYGHSAIGTALVEDNGRLTFTLPTEDGSTKTYGFVYWYCGDDGIILYDGKTLYFYNDGYSDRYGNDLLGNLTAEDMELVGNMDQEKLQAIVEKKADLLADLSAAFKDAGLAVTLNEETGEIVMDAAVLFAVGDATVSAEGKDLLKQFMTVYCLVVFDEQYKDFVSKIMVEGHTDSDGDYDMNLTLSQDRADSVKAFCLTEECGTSAYTSKLTDMLKAVGYSFDQLVYDENGNEDKAASRRVCFRFIINLEG